MPCAQTPVESSLARCMRGCRPLATSPHRIPPFDSAESGGVRPAAELRHIQRHKHGRDVRGSRLACPAPRPQSTSRGVAFPCTHVMCMSCAPPHRPPRIVSPPFDSAGSGAVQPAARLGHVPRHNHGGNVPGALRPCPALRLQSRAFTSLARCMHGRRPSATSPHHMPSFRLGRERGRSTSR